MLCLPHTTTRYISRIDESGKNVKYNPCRFSSTGFDPDRNSLILFPSCFGLFLRYFLFGFFICFAFFLVQKPIKHGMITVFGSKFELFFPNFVHQKNDDLFMTTKRKNEEVDEFISISILNENKHFFFIKRHNIKLSHFFFCCRRRISNDTF